MERKSKRQRVETVQRSQPSRACKSSDRSTTDQSNTLPVQQCSSLLSKLGPDMFSVMCSFLDLETKCRSLPLLNRTINQSFIPVICCRDHIQICDVCEPISHARLLGRASYFKYAKSVLVLVYNFGMSSQESQETYERIVMQALDDAIRNPNLIALTWRDYGPHEFPGTQALLDLLLDRTPDQLRNLRTLKFHCDTRWEPQRLDWRALTNCQSLHHLSIGFEDMDDHEFNGDYLSHIFDCLPVSLLTVDLPHFDVLRDMLTEKYLDPMFLPHLQKVDSNFDTTDDFMLALKTVMSATGRCRPIHGLNSTVNEPLYFSGLTAAGLTSEVRVIVVRVPINFLDSLFVGSSLPHLHTMEIHITASDSQLVDLSSLFIALSQSPLRKLDIGLPWYSSGDDCSKLARFASLSSEALAAWASMHQLERCHLRDSHTSLLGLRLFDGIDSPSVRLPPQSWKRMESLDILIHILPVQVEMLLAAAPKLKRFTGRRKEDILMLPAIGQCRPDIEEIHFEGRGPDNAPDVQTLQAAFQARPLSVNCFEHLRHLTCPHNLDHATTHFLFKQLSHLPLLKHADTISPSLEHFYLLSILPYVDSVSYDEHIFIRSNETAQCFAGEFHYPKRGVFRIQSDDPPLDGRARFFDIIRSRLPEKFLDQFEEWNAGKYLTNDSTAL